MRRSPVLKDFPASMNFPHFCEKWTWREVRTEKHITLLELSKRSGLGKSMINNIENGKTSPTLMQLEALEVALDVRITEKQ